ncbi:24905_t:CDS:2 [Entrophospora sp. SA101]|nr:24905_t:CDS:2 [Entrophospora sp. SA101]
MTEKSSKLFAKARGTQDILPVQAFFYQQIQQITKNILNKAGYQPVILPTYEYRELFTISVGETTDIVQKEMFIFSDRKGRQLALRPEGTASVVHNLPSYKEVLTENDLIYLGELNKILNGLAIKHFYNEHLVRGLDYYTGIVFELSLTDDKQVILGGGRYDQLFQQLGMIDSPAAGFALGVDRLVNYLSFLEKQHEKLSKNYKIVSNLEVKRVKNIFKNINYYSPRLAVIVGKKELEKGKILIRDCQEKKEFIIEQEKLVD